MFQIAVCDDEEESLQQTLNAAEQFFSKHREICGAIKTFGSPQDLLEYQKVYYESGKDNRLFDVYILDIMMPKINGITLGKRIRASGDNAPIVYLTSFKEYGYQAFEVQATDYLLKPVDSLKLVTVLEKIYSRLKKDRADYFCVKAKAGVHNILLRELVYAELVERSAAYHMKDGNVLTGVVIRGKFEEEMAGILKNPEFIQPHKSYLVNMQYIKDLMINELIMEDGTAIPVSRNRRAEVKKDYLRYVARTTTGGSFRRE